MTEPIRKGRGAALMQALQRRKQEQEQQQVGVTTSSTTPETAPSPPKPRGRAALLERLTAKVGGPPKAEPTPVTHSPSPQRAVEEVTHKFETTTLTPTVPVSFKGTKGKTTPVNIFANYIRMNVAPNSGVFEYEVRFEPEVDAKNRRIRLVNSLIREISSVKNFDGGSLLCLPKNFFDEKEIITTDNDETVKVKFIFKKKRQPQDCLHIYNVLFKRIMNELMYTQMGRKYFDTVHKYLIPQYKLEIYPGFAVSVDEKEDGLLLCLDTQHRVLRTQNVLDLLNQFRRMDQTQVKRFCNENVIGSAIFTRYNNKTYIVHDVWYDQNPTYTFETQDGNKISFVDYYKKQYNLDILDLGQPLLIHRQSIRVSGQAEKVDRIICLVPELCFLTGLTDTMRSDFKMMKAVAQYTRVTPAQRIAAMRTYLENVQRSESAKKILSDWGLTLDQRAIQLEGRRLENEVIFFGRDQKITSDEADWNASVTRMPLIGPVNMTKWIVFHTVRDTNVTKEFIQLMCKLGSAFGCRINAPLVVPLEDDRTDTYMKVCKPYLHEAQIAVFICPTMRSDRYSLIKKLCCVQIPIPSQVILAKTLSDPKKLRGITTKIALQMTCKLGGSLWTLSFPFTGWMVCGIDVYHEVGKESVCGFVASINMALTRWFSVAIFQKKELGDSYKIPFTKALEAYRKEAGVFPSKVIIYRDGTSDGQLEQSRRYEIEQFESVIKQFSLETTMCFIVVQKRINTKLYATIPGKSESSNPPPGTIIDHAVTRRYMKDFFLVSQHVRQGTVNPTHYIVLYDTCNLKPDIVQKLSYKMCHMYYNWPGTVRVPAPCLYAHKLAGLVGQHIKSAPSMSLADKLFQL